MKFPESWLSDFLSLPCSGEELANSMTMAGLESEELLPVAPPFFGVVVAKVLDVAKHPNADRLNICQVDVGELRPRQIVCGAPNVKSGLFVPCALPGVMLPNGIKIELAKVRGVESSGMLCSASELGLTEGTGGLLEIDSEFKPGTDIRVALSLDDFCHVLKLTPNRGDCLSILGVAREISAIFDISLEAPTPYAVSLASTATRAIRVLDQTACPQYLGRIIEGVNAKALTPTWMRQRLERAGLRSISALVDITNYVMLELGQPLHAFDNDFLEGAIQVRWAQPDEKLQLLNGQSVSLDTNALLIADDVKAVALAGVMGGEYSAVSLETDCVFLESAFFDPKAIAGRARRYGLTSDASHRFERGVDYGGTLNALERATDLVVQICGGRPAPIASASVPLGDRKEVSLRLPRLAKVLGVQIADADVLRIFSRLGFSTRVERDTVFVIPPSARFDIELEEDLIEEVARLHGYNNISNATPRAPLSMLPHSEHRRSKAAIRSLMVGLGYQEVINFTFVSEEWESDFSTMRSRIRLANPIASHMGVMRSNLIGGLLSNLITNQKRQLTRVRVFEIGRCFSTSDEHELVAGYHQPWRLGGLSWGPLIPEHWSERTQFVGFFDGKGDVEVLLGQREVNFVACNHPALHPGRSASIVRNGVAIGVVGELHPRWVQKLELGKPPVIFELALDPLLDAELPSFKSLSNMPNVIRDLALVVDAKIPLESVIGIMIEHQPPMVKEISLFDLYYGKGIPAGKKSIAFRIVMQDTEKTLQDIEVDFAIQNWVQKLTHFIGAELRS